MQTEKRRPRWGPPLLALALLTAAVVGCSARERLQAADCGARRLQLSGLQYERAKEKLAEHFRQRVDVALTEAYHASLDATALARATRGCPDFDELIRRQAIELIKANLLFQRLVVSNMRDQDPGVVADLYGSQYREIFKNDIR